MQPASTNSHVGLANAPSKHFVAQKAEHWFLSCTQWTFTARYSM